MKKYDTKKLTLTAILFALALVFSLIENAIPPIFSAVPGVKLGLSNIVIMFSLFIVGKAQTVSISVLKSLFVLILRGLVASFLSLLGGIFSILIMTILILIFKEKISYTILSISGAIFHNLGQFIAISILYTTTSFIAYLPILIISGIVAGTITSILLKTLMPVFKRFDFK